MKRIMGYISMIFILVLMSNTILYGNGGPAGSASSVEGGNIKFMNIEDIYLTQETLDITLKLNQVNVRVEYILENKGRELTTDYAFPVTLHQDEFCSFGRINDFNMYDGDIKLDYSTLTGDPVLTDENYLIYERTDYYISSLDFREGETKKLTIDYNVTPAYLNWSTSKSPFSSYGNKYFDYDLSPAANWGDGTIENFKVSIDARDIIEKGCRIVETSFDELDLSKSIMVYEAENFDILSHSKLSIEYEVEDYFFNRFLESRNFIGKVSKISSSSTLDLEKYGIMNMFDKDLSTCWSEGSEGLGVGDWIEVEFSEPITLMGVYFSNGYFKNEATYNNNSRVKTLRVEAKFYDPVNGYWDSIETYQYSDIEYGLEFWEIYDDFLELPYDSYMVSSFKIIIEDVYPGDKYQDLCISEMMILGYGERSDSIDSIIVEENVSNIIVSEIEGVDTGDDNSDKTTTVIESEERSEGDNNEEDEKTVESASNENTNQYNDSENESLKESNDLPKKTKNTTTSVDETTEHKGVSPFVVVGMVLITIIIILVIVIIIKKRKNS